MSFTVTFGTKVFKHRALQSISLVHNFTTRNNSSYDVVIAGGSVMGLSSAYFIKKMSPTTSVCVVERDSTVSCVQTYICNFICTCLIFIQLYYQYIRTYVCTQVLWFVA